MMNGSTLTCMVVAATLVLMACAKKMAILPPRTDSPAKPPVVVVQAMAQEPDKNEMRLPFVHFAFDSSTISPRNRVRLKGIARFIASHPGATVSVVGHCDLRGTPRYNVKLGKRRAEAVAAFLRSRVSSANYSLLSMGSLAPLCTEQTQECHARNRRAEVVVEW